METVKTATGKEFECDYFNFSALVEQLNIRVLHTTLLDVVAVFGKPAETAQLWYGSQYVSQCTKVYAIVPEGAAIRVVLGRR